MLGDPGAGWVQVLEGVSDAIVSGATPRSCEGCSGSGHLACPACLNSPVASASLALGEPLAPSGRTILWLGLVFVGAGAVNALSTRY